MAMIHLKQGKYELNKMTVSVHQFISLTVIINSSLAWKNQFSQVIYSIFIKTF